MLGDAIHFVNEAFKHAKTIGATNEGVDLVAAAQLQGVPFALMQPQAQLVSELGIVTIRNSVEMDHFCQKLIEAIAQHRHWLRQKQKESVPS